MIGINERYRDDAGVQEAVHSILCGSAPERNCELQQLWKLLNPQFQLWQDNDGKEARFVMDAGAYRYVRFNHRAVRAFWLASYVA